MTNAVQWAVFTVAYSYLMNSWYYYAITTLTDSVGVPSRDGISTKIEA